tara:strand:+ start:132986 stop:133492 length:507 start_codon:yes stop_codon:yes gene_type:complete
MKSLLKYALLFFTLNLLLSSCTANDEHFDFNEKSLVGIWHKTYIDDNENQTTKFEYHFKNDHNYEVLGTVLDATSQELLGYWTRETGSYSLTGDQLLFHNIKSYFNNDQTRSYTEFENLELQQSDFNYSRSVTIEFNDFMRKLVFIYPPCGPNESCVGSLTLEKSTVN